jgi:NAD(P)H-dependent FMN reductase
MLDIVGITGSLRKGSLNTALLRAAAAAAPEGCKVEVTTLHGIPLYDGDLEASEGLPRAAAQLKERIAAADGVLIASPEYNNSIPGVVKNAIDWLSRPPKDIPRIFGERPFGIIGASNGMGGTRLGQNAWLPVLRVLGTRSFFGKSVYVAGADAFDQETGALVDPKTLEVVKKYMASFATFVADARGKG